ncbi:MAG TPA: hypothetical protein VFE61_26630 [Candidatus Sulfotelmatobacter sp.]|jgi:hypothetical protein|nr:hypothetical protein [Candidatus Sulfotelmatobacter sp.]
METKRSSDKMTPYLPASKLSDNSRWIIEQLTILAVAVGEAPPPERLRIYAQDLNDGLTKEQLHIAFTRARRESKFFPKIAELREWAGYKTQDVIDVQARDAWQTVQHYIRKHGYPMYPTFMGRGEDGEIRWSSPEPLPPRIAYAVRAIGGLRAVNDVTTQALPFMVKDFIIAFNQAPLSELLALDTGREDVKGLATDHSFELKSAARADKYTGQCDQTSEEVQNDLQH